MYTLDGTTTGGSNGYATESDIIQNSMKWKVMGNTTESPWRIGGKSLSNVDRPIYSTTSMSSTVSNLKIEVGAASNITVNSLKLIVSGNANFSNPIDEITKTFAANSTIEFIPTSSSSWPVNSYYKIIFNVSVNGSTNRFVEFKNVKFYGNSGSFVTTPVISGTTPFDETTEVSIACSSENSTIYYTTDGSTPDNTSNLYTGAFTISETTTVKAVAYVNDNHSDIATSEFVKNVYVNVESLSEVNNLADNTNFIFNGEVVCISQHGQYLYVEDNTSGGLIYGDINQTYETTNVIPYGWKGVKTTYNGFTEIRNATGFSSYTNWQRITATELTLDNISNTDLSELPTN